MNRRRRGFLSPRGNNNDVITAATTHSHFVRTPAERHRTLVGVHAAADSRESVENVMVLRFAFASVPGVSRSHFRPPRFPTHSRSFVCSTRPLASFSPASLFRHSPISLTISSVPQRFPRSTPTVLQNYLLFTRPQPYPTWPTHNRTVVICNIYITMRYHNTCTLTCVYGLLYFMK